MTLVKSTTHLTINLLTVAECIRSRITAKQNLVKLDPDLSEVLGKMRQQKRMFQKNTLITAFLPSVVSLYAVLLVFDFHKLVETSNWQDKMWSTFIRFVVTICDFCLVLGPVCGTKCLHMDFV